METIDISELVSPVSDDSPAGTDASGSSEYLNLTVSLNEALQDEERAEESTPSDQNVPLPGDVKKLWQDVKKHSSTILREQSKDLKAASAWAKAMVRLEGYRGFEAGLRLLEELIEAYWPADTPDEPTLFPRPDEYGIETTYLPLKKLNGGERITQALDLTNITEGEGEDAFSTSDYRFAQHLNTLSESERQTQLNEGMRLRRFKRTIGIPTVSEVTSVADRTSPEFFREQLEAVNECRRRLSNLEQIVAERNANSAKPVKSFDLTFFDCDKSLQYTETVIRELAGDRLNVDAESEGAVEAGGDESGTAPAAAAGGPVDNQISSRDHAFQVLEKVAGFFEKTEPQSTLPAQIRKIVRIGRLRPDELLGELIDDDSVRRKVFELLGFAVTESDD